MKPMERIVTKIESTATSVAIRLLGFWDCVVPGVSALRSLGPWEVYDVTVNLYTV